MDNDNQPKEVKMVWLMCLVLHLSGTAKEIVLYDVKGNQIYFNNLIKESDYTLIISVNFKKSRVSKEVRLFIEDSFARQLENNVLGVYQLLDLSEYKNNSFLRNVVLSTLKKQNAGKPVLIDFDGDFEETYHTDKDKISCLLFDRHGSLKWALYFDFKFSKESRDSLYRALNQVLSKGAGNFFTIKDVGNWEKLLKDLKVCMEEKPKVPLSRLIQFEDTAFIKSLILWNSGEPPESLKNLFISSLNSIVGKESFYSKEYWPDSLLNEDEKKIIEKAGEFDKENAGKLNFLLIKDILEQYKMEE